MADQIPEQNARQGKSGKPMLYVLIASLALLALAITGLMTWQTKNSPADYASQTPAGATNPSAGTQPQNGLKTDMPASTGSTVPANNPPATTR